MHILNQCSNDYNIKFNVRNELKDDDGEMCCISDAALDCQVCFIEQL